MLTAAITLTAIASSGFLTALLSVLLLIICLL